MRRRWIILTLTMLLWSVIQQLTFAEEMVDGQTEEWRQKLFSDKLENPVEDVSFMERMLAGLVTAVPKFLIWVMNLQDINELVYLQNDWIYHTFPAEIWSATGDFYDVLVGLGAYLLVIALLIWGFILLFRAGTPMGQGTIRDMSQGIMIYILGIWLGSYLFDLIFKVNEFFVKLAISVLKQNGIPLLNFIDLFLILQDVPSLGHAIMFLIVIFSIGILNYQYALRMLILVILIILFPVCAYSSIFPASRKALDMWMREFLSQVFMNGGHAIAYSLMLIMMAKGASLWIIWAFLFGLPTIAGMTRIIFGAPGGLVKGSSGVGSLVALQGMTRMIQGNKGNVISSSAMTGVVRGGQALGVAAAASSSTNPMLSGMRKTMNHISAEHPSFATFAKGATVTTAAVGGAIAGGALTGGTGAGVGAAAGFAGGKRVVHSLAQKGQSGEGLRVLDQSFDRNRHRMNVAMPFKTNNMHDQNYANQHTPSNYELGSVRQQQGKGVVASYTKGGSQGGSVPVAGAAPQSNTRPIPSSGGQATNQNNSGPQMTLNSTSNTTSKPAQAGQQGPTIHTSGGQQQRAPQPGISQPGRNQQPVNRAMNVTSPSINQTNQTRSYPVQPPQGNVNGFQQPSRPTINASEQSTINQQAINQGELSATLPPVPPNTPVNHSVRNGSHEEARQKHDKKKDQQ